MDLMVDKAKRITWRNSVGRSQGGRFFFFCLSGHFSFLLFSIIYSHYCHLSHRFFLAPVWSFMVGGGGLWQLEVKEERKKKDCL